MKMNLLTQQGPKIFEIVNFFFFNWKKYTFTNDYSRCIELKYKRSMQHKKEKLSIRYEQYLSTELIKRCSTCNEYSVRI